MDPGRAAGPVPPAAGRLAGQEGLEGFLLASETVFAALLGEDGRLLACSPAALDLLGTNREEAAQKRPEDWLTAPDAEQLRQRLAGFPRDAGARFLLNLVEMQQSPRTLGCGLFGTSRGILLVGERPAAGEHSLATGLFQLNNQLAVLNRENARKSRELTRRTAELEERNRELEEAKRTIERLARQDALTQVANRRFFDEMLAFEVERCARLNGPLGMIMVDLDHFKAINDRYGHPVGDAVLAAVGACLKETVRPYDLVARLGGEEFAVLSPGIELEKGVALAERLRRRLEGLAVREYPRRVTASFGVAVLTPGEGAAELLRRADAALYRAKAGGRNRVVAEPGGGLAIPGGENR